MQSACQPPAAAPAALAAAPPAPVAEPVAPPPAVQLADGTWTMRAHASLVPASAASGLFA